MEKKYFTKSLLALLFTAFIFLQTDGQVRLFQVDPGTGIITLKNFGSSAIDVSGYRFCHGNFNYTSTVANMTPVSGNPTNLMAGGLLTLSGATLTTGGSGLGLYLPGVSSGDFALPSKMVDFVQWVSGGNVREDVAAGKIPPLWSAGDFISVPAPYQYTGPNGTENGVTFWETVLGTEDFKNQSTFSIFPNPTVSILNLQLSSSFINGNVNVFDILGKQVLSKEISANNAAQLDVSTLSKGMYIVQITSRENTQTKRFIKQ